MSAEKKFDMILRPIAKPVDEDERTFDVAGYIADRTPLTDDELRRIDELNARREDAFRGAMRLGAAKFLVRTTLKLQIEVLKKAPDEIALDLARIREDLGLSAGEMAEMVAKLCADLGITLERVGATKGTQ